MRFDFDNVATVVFGVGTRSGANPVFYDVPVDKNVEANLVQMARVTRERMLEVSTSPGTYEPSNQSAGRHHISVPIGDPAVALFNDLLAVDNFTPGIDALREPRTVFCYFARLKDDQNNSIMAMRRSSSFKGLLSQKGRLMRLVDDALEVTEDDQFRLDYDFDLLVDADEVRVLHPAGFESIAQLQQLIKDRVPQNISALSASLPFVDFGNIENIAGTNLRAARMLASIRAIGTSGVTLRSLRDTCDANKVMINTNNGLVTVQPDHVIGFLETLDRRRFRSTVVEQGDEVFTASSRRPV